MEEDIKNGTIIGKGSYATIYNVNETDKGCDTVCKKLIDHDDNDYSSLIKELICYRTLNQSNGLCKLKFNQSITKLYYEKGKYDLFKVIYYKTQKLSVHEIYKIIKNLVKIIKYAHEHLIIHRDLKPANIIVMSDDMSDIRVIDWGMCCIVPEVEGYGTNSWNVTTPWYRAPEVQHKKLMDYSMDIWSIGCIAGELLLKKPLFEVYNDNYDIIVNKKLKNISQELINECKIRCIEDKNKNTEKECILIIDLITRCLELDPLKRATINECKLILGCKDNYTIEDDKIKYLKSLYDTYSPPEVDTFHPNKLEVITKTPYIIRNDIFHTLYIMDILAKYYKVADINIISNKEVIRSDEIPRNVTEYIWLGSSLNPTPYGLISSKIHDYDVVYKKLIKHLPCIYVATEYHFFKVICKIYGYNQHRFARSLEILIIYNVLTKKRKWHPLHICIASMIVISEKEKYEDTNNTIMELWNIVKDWQCSYNIPDINKLSNDLYELYIKNYTYFSKYFSKFRF